MILVDEALKARERASKPIRVGLIGAGFMAQGLTNQVTNSVPGMEISAIFNRTPTAWPGSTSTPDDRMSSKPAVRARWKMRSSPAGRS